MAGSPLSESNPYQAPQGSGAVAERFLYRRHGLLTWLVSLLVACNLPAAAILWGFAVIEWLAGPEPLERFAQRAVEMELEAASLSLSPATMLLMVIGVVFLAQIVFIARSRSSAASETGL